MKTPLDEDGFEDFNVAVADPHVTSAWIAPDGRFYPCPAFAHERAASKIADIFGLPSDLTGDQLIAQGWMKVTRDGGVSTRRVYARSSGEYGTQAQLDTLFDLYQVFSQTPGLERCASDIAAAIDEYEVVDPPVTPTVRRNAFHT